MPVSLPCSWPCGGDAAFAPNVPALDGNKSAASSESLGIAGVGSTSSSTTSATVSAPAATKGLVAVFIEGAAATRPTVSAAWSGAGMTLAASHANSDGSNENAVYLFYADDVTSGNVEVTLSAARDFGVYVFRLTGAAGGAPEDTATASAAGTTISASVTPTSDDSIVIGVVGVAVVSATLTADNGATELVEFDTTGTNTMTCGVSYEVRSDVTAQTVQFTSSASAVRAALVAAAFGAA